MEKMSAFEKEMGKFKGDTLMETFENRQEAFLNTAKLTKIYLKRLVLWGMISVPLAVGGGKTIDQKIEDDFRYITNNKNNTSLGELRLKNGDGQGVNTNDIYERTLYRLTMMKPEQ